MLCLLVGALLFAASGVLTVALHDHDANGYCRVCSVGAKVAAPLDDQSSASIHLEASPAPTITALVDTNIRMLAATPLRGPPHLS